VITWKGLDTRYCEGSDIGKSKFCIALR